MAEENTNAVTTSPSARGEPATTDMGWTGYGPWPYRLLPEPLLSEELARLSDARAYDLHGASAAVTDGGPAGSPEQEVHAGSDAFSVSLQPCPDAEARSQDRYAVQSWEMQDGRWTFAGVFDGASRRYLLTS